MVKIDPIQTTLPRPVSADKAAQNSALREKANAFEAAFIAQMLKHSGLEKAITDQSGFGGEAYASLMLEQYAGKIVENGGFGLADKIYAQLADKERAGGTDDAL